MFGQPSTYLLTGARKGGSWGTFESRRALVACLGVYIRGVGRFGSVYGSRDRNQSRTMKFGISTRAASRLRYVCWLYVCLALLFAET